MKYVCFFILLFGTYFNNAQKKHCLEEIPVNLIDCNPVNLIRNSNYLNTIDSSTIKEGCKWAYYLRKSVYSLYLNEDSASYFLKKSLAKSVNGTCKYIKVSDHMFDMKAENQQEFLRNFYVSLDIEDKNLIDSVCGEFFKKEIIDKPEQSILSKRIMYNDQVERNKDPINWKLVDALDLKNRKLLDSLYDVHRSFVAFTEAEQDAFSFVLHHSSDCEWIYKWLEIWINEELKGNLKGGMVLGPAFKRMISSKDGYCTEQDAQKRDYFIYMIKDKYPAFVEKYQLD